MLYVQNMVCALNVDAVKYAYSRIFSLFFVTRDSDVILGFLLYMLVCMCTYICLCICECFMLPCGVINDNHNNNNNMLLPNTVWMACASIVHE